MPDPTPTDTGLEYHPTREDNRREYPVAEDTGHEYSPRFSRNEEMEIAKEERAEARRIEREQKAEERKQERREAEQARRDAAAQRREDVRAAKDAARQAKRDAAEKLRQQAKIDREVEKVRRRQSAEDKRWKAEAEREEKRNPKPPKKEPITVKTVAKKVGNIIVSGTKEVISDGSGRSGKRASKAYRQANRQYKSEARRMRSQVKSVGSFSSMMLTGEDKMPVRSRHAGMQQFAGTADPLSNFASGILGGMGVQSQQIEAVGTRMARDPYTRRKPQTDRLTDFSRKIMGL